MNETIIEVKDVSMHFNLMVERIDSIKEYIIKVIDDYGIIINKLKEFLLQEYR